MSQQFHHVQYHDVGLSEIYNIQIELRDDSGDLVLLKEGRTMIKLRFIRVA